MFHFHTVHDETAKVIDKEYHGDQINKLKKIRNSLPKFKNIEFNIQIRRLLNHLFLGNGGTHQGNKVEIHTWLMVIFLTISA